MVERQQSLHHPIGGRSQRLTLLCWPPRRGAKLRFRALFFTSAQMKATGLPDKMPSKSDSTCLPRSCPFVGVVGDKPLGPCQNFAVGYMVELLLVLPENRALVHVGGVICGQATAAAADTCSVVALSALNGRFRICTTVDLTTHFIRPLKPGDVEIRVDVLSNGKRMAYTKVEMRAKGEEKIAVTATSAFAYLED